MIVFLFYFTISFLLVANAKEKSDSKAMNNQSDNDFKGLMPFFLQDPYDQMCLGPEGFTNCDERALWILTRRSGKKSYSLVSFLSPNSDGVCLQRKPSFLGIFSSKSLTLGSCKRHSSKAWEWEFLDKQLVRLTNGGLCLARGKGQHKSSISLEPCQKNEVLPLLYHPTAVHENGFYLKSADGSCFDGSTFRSCTGSGSGSLLWGVGVKYNLWGEAQQYLFGFSKKDKSCLVRGKGGRSVQKGDCDSTAALGWALYDGKLTSIQQKTCVARSDNDAAIMLSCKTGSEYISMELPSVYTTEELAAMLQDPNLSESQKSEIRSAIVKSGKV